ncbi:MAG TPA: arginine--tRNA ligase [Thermoanaerobaculia bacterium]|nr:arginine--tRNA ligase [Thermoanaerobaculia bacterium]
MWTRIREDVAARLAARIRDLYGVEHAPVAEVPPRRELGDLAFPAPLHLARELKRRPREIAQEIAAGLELPPPVRQLQVAGAGYLNVFLARPAAAAAWVDTPQLLARQGLGKIVVEHTNINPNKAAHIGHLRNAVLGDVLSAALRSLGYPVEVQNYIDDTGVQVADVVVGFLDLREMSPADVEAVAEPFDHYCWDLYGEVGRWLEQDPERRQLRRQTLHALERGEGERAAVGRVVARRVLARHLGTMRRLGIGYDLLTHESDILAFDFFSQAFERLQHSGAVRLETEGKNAGCWMMPLAAVEEFAGLEEPDKVIVRSDGTITYVGKDIAYQLWKFGLLGRDFRYRQWAEQGVWETTSEEGDPVHPGFGNAERVVNVIDIRQSYLQKIVRAGLEALGHEEQATRSTHFAYEMVALSPATARLLGFAAEEAEGKTLEMSGRKGVGVKADDLLDRLQEKAREEIAARNRELADPELSRLAAEIATAALRVFMVKASTNRIIAFDFDEALSFEGDSGPYLQYALVRVRNIQRKLEAAGLSSAVAADEVAALPAELWSDDLWDLAHAAAQIGDAVDRGARTLELSLIARHALELAQRFNAVYHRHPILQEEDRQLRTVRLAATQIFAHALGALCGVLGVPIPERM